MITIAAEPLLQYSLVHWTSLTGVSPNDPYIIVTSLSSLGFVIYKFPFLRIAMRYNKTNRDWSYRSLLEIVSPSRHQAIFSKLWLNNFQQWPQHRSIIQIVSHGSRVGWARSGEFGGHWSFAQFVIIGHFTHSRKLITNIFIMSTNMSYITRCQ